MLGLDTTAAAVEGYREAAELAASHPQAQAGYLADEAVAVRVTAVNTGDAAAAREAVRLLRDALALGGPEHRDHPVFCSWLGSALVGRYVRHGAVGDLEEALDWHERAVAGLRPGRVGAARWFASRAYARRLHAQLTGRAEDVSAAVAAFKAALEAEPDARRLPDVLAGLGSALDLRGDTLADLNAAIEARTEAVRLASDHDRYRGMWLSDLANSLRRRGELLGDAGSADLAESHRLHREAVEVTPSDHPEYATVLSNLAGSHRDRYVRTGAQADLDAALDLLRRAAATVTAPALPRFVAAETGARLAADTGRWTDAAAVYATAINLLPAAAWRGGDRAGRERPLRDARWLAAEAVAAALEQNDPAGAVDLLERGRTVLWNQRTETGTDLAALRDIAPELADRLDAARAVLDGEPDPDRTTDARIAAAAAWDTAWTQLRGRPELAGLLAPPPWSATPEGTIAAVVVSRYRRDALLVGDDVRALPLTRLDLDELADRLGDYYRALSELIDPVDQAERRAGERRLTALLAWLGDSVVDPVLDAVTPGARLWWCPIGPFAALPLHAAGSAPERVVASYTPSLAALRRARGRRRPAHRRRARRHRRARGRRRPLPGTVRELDALAAALPGDLAFTRLDDATRAAVATGLADCAWAHLACHAEQDLAQPVPSRVPAHRRATAPHRDHPPRPLIRRRAPTCPPARARWAASTSPTRR